MDLPDPGIKPGSAALQVDSLPTELSCVFGGGGGGKQQQCTYTLQTHVVQGQTILENLVKYIGSFTIANVYHCGKTVTN